MPILVEALVRRTMKQTEGFVAADSKNPSPPELPKLVPGESLIGWYTNPPPHQSVRVFFTTKAIVLLGPDRTVRLPLREITSWRTTEAKNEVSGVTVEMGDERHFIPFAGRRGPGGKFMDAFDLATMLNVIVNASSDALPA